MLAAAGCLVSSIGPLRAQGSYGQTATGRTVGTGNAGARQQNVAGASQAAPGTAGNAGLEKRSEDGPIDISSDAETTFATTPQGRVATATGNVNVQTTDASIYCDHAEYNLDTHEALLVGGVRIYRLDTTILAERAVYNFDTKAIRALDYQGTKVPYEVGGISAFSPGAGALFTLRDSVFTTDDSSKPDYFLRSRRVRIYPDNRVIFIGATLYVGTTPVFYFPYFYQSLDAQSGYAITPGYSSEYGAYLLTGVTFPITEKLTGLVRLDYRTTRGIAGGLSFDYKPNRKAKEPPTAANDAPFQADENPLQAPVVTLPDLSPRPTPTPAENTNANGQNSLLYGQQGYAPTGDALSAIIRSREGTQFLSYVINDEEPDLNRTALGRFPVGDGRYRVELKDTTFITDDLFFKIDADKLSDRYLLQDFYEGEFTRDPNPDNDASLVFSQPGFITTLVTRVQLNAFSAPGRLGQPEQLNTFFDATERLPELAFEVPRTPIFNTGLFYESENTTGYLHRTFDTASPLPEYDAFRVDTFHQLTYPRTYFDWLSVVPRVGVRATYYSASAPSNSAAYDLQNTQDEAQLEYLAGIDPANPGSGATSSDLTARAALEKALADFHTGGSLVRPVVDAGVEVSFKLTRIYENVEDRDFGLDRLQHVIQPYLDFSEVEDFGVGSNRILQFDRLLPSTQLAPIEFPEFTSIDSIDDETVARLGVRNRLQTKRDALTFDWLEVDSFFQVAKETPVQPSRFSNFFNNVNFRPLPWVTLTLDSQLPVFNGNKGFYDVDSALNFQVTSNLDLNVSDRYLDHNPFFQNSNLVSVGAYYRLNDNWAAGFSERYEFAQHQLQAQSYTVYRDLSSFVASLGFTVRDNDGIDDYGLLLSFTLKGVPKVNLPVGFDVNSVLNQSTAP
jgi:lipopolysaccharide export system protein LptA